MEFSCCSSSWRPSSPCLRSSSGRRRTRSIARCFAAAITRAGIRWDARRGPLFERGDQRVLSEIFGGADVARDAREADDQAWRFDTPHGVDRGVNVALFLTL